MQASARRRAGMVLKPESIRSVEAVVTLLGAG